MRCIAEQERSREREERDRKILQGARDDDRAQIAIESAHDEAEEDAERGQWHDGAKAFI